MMKLASIFFIFLTVLPISLFAGESRNYFKISSSKAQVKIITEERDSTQAAAYVDGKENDKFIQDMLKDKSSKLFKIKQTIESENCSRTSIPIAKWIAGCGEVTLTKLLQTSFGRGGWESGGATYTFFVGFTTEGSGHFFEVYYMVVISETAEADKTSSGDYAGSITKTLNLSKVTRMDNTPFK
jgi:hypothetical protein